MILFMYFTYLTHIIWNSINTRMPRIITQKENLDIGDYRWAIHCLLRKVCPWTCGILQRCNSALLHCECI